MNITLATGRKNQWSYLLKNQCHKKENFNSTSRGVVKKVILNRLGLHSYLRLACTKRGVGPTAKATETMEPAIPADLQ